MKLAQFNPKSDIEKFCPILHPVSGDPIKDEDGVPVGIFVYSHNSKIASSSVRELNAQMAKAREDVCLELGRKEVVTADDAVDAGAWEKENKAEIDKRLREVTAPLFLQHVIRCCSSVQGRIESDSGQLLDSPSKVLSDPQLEWVADQVVTFHRNLDNWVPKLQDS